MPSIPGVRSRAGFLSASLLVLLVATTAVAQPETPELTRPVNDFANVIDPDSERQLESLIRALQETTGDVVVVATIDSLKGEDVYQYAERMFRNRGKGIGQAGKDNGLLMLVAVKDRQIKVEVGYDLEQFITDGSPGRRSARRSRLAFDRVSTAPGSSRVCSASSGASARDGMWRFQVHRVRLSGVAHRVAAAQVETSSF